MQKDEVEMSGGGGATLSIFLLGLASGVALTVLLVPRSGAATRRLIGRTVREGDEWINAKAAAAKGYVKSQGEDLRQRVKDVAAVIGRSSPQTEE